MERPDVIRKTPGAQRVAPNLADYAAARAAFSWDAARRELAGLPGGGLNIAWEAVERHAADDRLAFRFLSAEGGRRDVSFAELSRLTSRFANVLRSLGVGKGDRVFILAGRIPELYIAALGALKNGSVVAPLFSAFGPEPIATRMKLGAEKLRGELPALEHVLLADSPEFARMMGAASERFETVRTQAEDMALLHFTSGTTGRPKGAVHVHGAVLTHYVTGRYALDLHPQDVFWCTADPGWVTGTSYGIIAPLLHGVTSVVDEAEFDAARWYQILQEQRISVWYTAPTAIRMLMKAGAELARARSYPELRFVASVGEPLNPEAVWWGMDAFDMPIHDNWWQTETGG